MTHPIVEALQYQEADRFALRHRAHQQPIGFQEHKNQRRSGEAKQLGRSYEVDCGRRGPVEVVCGRLKWRQTRQNAGAARRHGCALPMQERSGKAWASETDGCFHGCGHDRSPLRCCMPQSTGAHPSV